MSRVLNLFCVAVSSSIFGILMGIALRNGKFTRMMILALLANALAASFNIGLVWVTIRKAEGK